jgi:pyruvate dehydrogenase E2 component (dihydrolipoamide acetyltransferase)
MAREVEVRVPDMGDFKDVTVIDVLVKPGDTIEADAPLVTLETEKAAMDVPSTLAGVIEKVHVTKSSKVSTGRPARDRARAEAAAEPAAPTPAAPAPAAPVEAAAVPAPAPAAAPASAPAPAPEPPPEPAARAAPPVLNPNVVPVFNELGFSKAYASPSVRKLAREMGVDLAQVKGTGPKARISHDDVKAFVKRMLTSAAAPASAPLARGADDRLQPVRPGRIEAAVAHPAHLRPASACELGQHSARHAV